MTRRIQVPIVLCALALSPGLAVAGASASAPAAHMATGCSSSSPSSLKGGYYLGLSVKGVGCSTGRSVQAAWQNCRLKHGAAGRCSSKVVGFTCHEVRNAIPTQVTGKVSCKRGRATVGYTYQQNVV